VAQGTTPTLATFMNIGVMPNNKTDINNNGAVSTDFIGQSSSYPEADNNTRAQIWQAHKNYTQGFFYFLAHDPRVPAGVQSQALAYGLCKDEFADNGGWPYQLYVREARRMVSDYVMTQSNCLGQATVTDSIGLAAYTMDSHNCQRVAVSGYAQNEGDTEIGSGGPYPVSYRSIVPRAGECTNLLVPWCLSASHIGFGSIRMEPVFMILAQAAGTAAALALDDGVPVQQVSIPKLQAQLAADKQLLQWGTTSTGLVVDNADSTGVTLVGTWTSSTSISGYYGNNYITDGNSNKGVSSVTFTPTLPTPGAYQVFVRWTANPNRATNVPIDIIHPAGTNTFVVDQTQQGGQWVLLVTTNFNAGTNGKVRIRTTGTTGFVIADAVQFVNTTNQATVSLWATDARPCRFGPHNGSFTVSRAGSTNTALTVYLSIGGTAVNGSDYRLLPAAVVLPAGVASSNIAVVPYTNSQPVGDKTITVSLVSDPAYSLGSLAAATLTLRDVPLFNWRLDHFGPDATNSVIAGDDANPSGDGIPNLLKYALGLDPTSAQTNPVLFPNLDPMGNLTVCFTRPDPPPTDITYQSGDATNLTAWCYDPSCTPIAQILLQSNNTVAAITFAAMLPAGSPAGFFRLRVSRK